ncbi:MAG: DNA recombination protein RmuC [Balneolaceae bacterium]|nr:DNA recombination protein RmuC [Balneolaceae bacterium]MBO6547049.1 DNA recombination protein RmuC [Balneolaceae bacterium]MBO6648004.1 DNA recombination protein RmuC [Balneolaceae bacterium]
MDTTTAIIALIIGGIAGFLIAHFKSKSETSRLEERNANLEKQAEETESKLDQITKEKEEELKTEREEKANLDRQLAGLKAEYSSLQEKLSDQKEELAGMQEQLKVQFENLANKILDEKAEKFTKQNRENLDQLLNPLGLKLEEFKKKVEETYNDENRQRATLKEQIKQMAELNQKMSDDAKSLTKALKGDSKAQGNWGEVILERILERSGLSKGREYEVQQSATTEEGRRLQPDVVVHLPDEKYLIIDSKVSLTAYERFASSDDNAEAESAIKQHVASLRAHVKGLSAKNYQQIHGDRSPDFVLLFVPIEPAFGIALQSDPNLYYEAFDRNIVIVSPSTLLATLATIDSVWKQEYQNKNALEIAQRGGALYDKFVLFVESMEQIGDRIQQTQRSYEEAKTRLSEGSGNLVRQAEMLKELGAKASKKLPDSFTGNE